MLHRIRALALAALTLALLCLPGTAHAQPQTAAAAATTFVGWDDPSVRDFYFQYPPGGPNVAKMTVGTQAYYPCSHPTYCSPTHIRTAVQARNLNTATGIKVVLQRGGYVNPGGVWYESSAEVLDGGTCCANAYGPWIAKGYGGLISPDGLCPSGYSVTWVRGSIDVRVNGVLLGFTGLSDPGRLCESL